jgi:hypothetical protein
LESISNPEISKIIESVEQGNNIMLNQASKALLIGTNQVEPTNFYQAWDHQGPRD